MRRLIFAPSASDDLNSIHQYIAQRSPSVAVQWIDKIEQKCRLLKATPYLGERRPEFGASIRCTYVGRYVIFYRPAADQIEIVRIIPGDRDTRML